MSLDPGVLTFDYIYVSPPLFETVTCATIFHWRDEALMPDEDMLMIIS